MTKKHFEAIAKIIDARLRSTNNKEVQKQLLYLVDDLGTYFATVNDLFDYQRFMDRCGFTETQLEKML